MSQVDRRVSELDREIGMVESETEQAVLQEE